MKQLITIKKTIAVVALVAFVSGPAALSFIVSPSVAHASTLPNWNTTGSYVVDMQYNGSDNLHDVSLTQDSSGNLTGTGGSPSGANVYTWAVTSGSVSGDAITVAANYTATADAVTPQTVLNLTGTIASNGTLSGTWSDNYQGGTRTGSFTTTSGAAVAIMANPASTLAAQDFGVMDVSGVKGYTAGFGLTNGTFAGATSVVTKLYSGATLLQTDTAIIPKFNADITGTQFSSPFDVFGTFNYATDGYWTNVRSSEYGQTLIPTSVVATVTLANGAVVTATNTTLTGDTSTLPIGTIGSVGGTVTGGASAGILGVTSVTNVTTTSIADGTFTNGWKYVFNVTIPTNESHLYMKFGNWSDTSGSGSIPVANNVRISSPQADNSGATVAVTAANTYTTPALHMTTDLDPTLDGMQVQVTVETATPIGSINGAYTTSYGVKTL